MGVRARWRRDVLMPYGNGVSKRWLEPWKESVFITIEHATVLFHAVSSIPK